jgi:hypothetical protein
MNNIRLPSLCVKQAQTIAPPPLPPATHGNHVAPPKLPPATPTNPFGKLPSPATPLDPLSRLMSPLAIPVNPIAPPPLPPATPVAVKTFRGNQAQRDKEYMDRLREIQAWQPKTPQERVKRWYLLNGGLQRPTAPNIKTKIYYNPTLQSGNSFHSPARQVIAEIIAESAERNFENLRPIKYITTGHGAPLDTKKHPLGENSFYPFGGDAISIGGTVRGYSEPDIVAHEVKHSDVPYRSSGSQLPTKKQWMQHLGTPDNYVSKEQLNLQLRDIENRSESAIHELLEKDPKLGPLLESWGYNISNIRAENDSHRQWYVNENNYDRGPNAKIKTPPVILQMTDDETARIPVNTAYVEGSKNNFMRNARRGSFIGKDRERLKQYSPEKWVDDDVKWHYPSLVNSPTGADTLAKNHAEQVRDMQDYYNPNGSVRQRSYQKDPTTGKWNIVAPQFYMGDKNLAEMPYFKDVPVSKLWMFSPSNRVYNAQSQIITHSAALKEPKKHPVNNVEEIIAPKTFKETLNPFSMFKEKPWQSPDRNKWILENPDTSRPTALMLSDPLKNLNLSGGQLPPIPSGNITDPNGKPLRTNKDVNYLGPLPPAKKR